VALLTVPVVQCQAFEQFDLLTVPVVLARCPPWCRTNPSGWWRCSPSDRKKCPTEAGQKTPPLRRGQGGGDYPLVSQ
jgi:hypothetical protein